ncbi:MAG: mechanosensitive ion channel family protein [Thiothrix litoralis]|uniref:mechanosensitive ion channel domain-containing protein n=1 Tax=Thiothrix litoralis TaxID=2891210 RepID=UPI003C74EEB6
MNIRICMSVLLLTLSLFSTNLYADQLTDLLGGKAAETAADTSKVIATGSSVQGDKKIRERLQSIFAELDALKTVSISVNNGVVTLGGEVDSSASETKALQFAKQVEGVVEVQNDLVINRSMSKRLQNTWDKLLVMGKQTIAALPLFLLGLLVFLLFWMLGGWISRRQNLFRRISPNAFIANLLGQITHLVFIMLGLVLALSLLDATALLGTILGAAGIVGLAVGFAVRDTVENYIASILLSVRNPFEVNDLVNIDNFEGNVASLNSRATVLISPDGNHIRIPNATVFKAIITNFTRNPERRFQFDVGVDTDQNLLTAQTLAMETLQAMPGVMPEPKPAALIEALGDSNVQLRIFGWVDQRQNNFGKVRSEAIRGVKQAFDQAGIVMPEPIYNLRINQQSETPPSATPTSASVEDRSEAQDVSADRTIEDKVLSEQTSGDSENLLTPNAPKE